MEGVLGLIPARGTSKRVPRKNIRAVGGRPLIEWTIVAAQQSCVVNRLMVSTDDPEIADLSRRLGADVPFLRPAELAADESTSVEVVTHALQWLQQNESYRPECLLLLQPTSPLRSAEDICGAVELMRSRRAACVVSVRLLSHPLCWMKRISEDGRLSDALPKEVCPTIGRSSEPVCVPNGAIYLATSEWFQANKTFFGTDSCALVMPDDRSLDVDTEGDLQLADLMLRHRTASRHEAD